MADISKIIVPGGSTYNIKDKTARTNANSAQTKADNAYNLASAAVPASSIITTAQIEQIWEDN